MRSSRSFSGPVNAVRGFTRLLPSNLADSRATPCLFYSIENILPTITVTEIKYDKLIMTRFPFLSYQTFG